ncbi:MAG: hypothetical protein J4N81_13935 [Chloroflexi bacterium]|nr:hypothetical protein [Chloroflexota bacterium]
MPTVRPQISASVTPSPLSVWINRALESLWLLTVTLVPLAFFYPDYVFSEAVIAYVEVPKIAILRTLVGLMTVLWLIEWGMRERIITGARSKGEGIRLQPRTWLAKMNVWLRLRPARWLVLAVWFYLGSVVLSTLLSGSFNVSLWGEIPGQDGYATYTIISYLLLFGVIATHLRTPAQLWRLLGAIVVMGSLVGGYAVLQHYGHDFFRLILSTGGGTQRVSSTMGNTIFAAAVLSMTIPISLLAASLSLRRTIGSGEGIRANRQALMPALLVAVLWGLILMVQLLGITFTLSRGPWLGTLVALLGLLGLIVVSVGLSVLGRTALLLGVPAALTLAIVQWKVPISSPILWLGAIFSQAILLAAASALGWRTVGRFALVLGLATMLAAAVFLMPAWFKSDDAPTGDEGTRQQTLVQQRIGTVLSSQKFSGAIAGRWQLWRVSSLLMRDHPWFGFDELSLRWLRPLIGYGPDLFRYTYLLKSPPDPFLPSEADHAHNYLIHQGVELGILGLLGSLSVFVSVFVVGGYQLLRERHSYSVVYTLVLVGLLATIAGRFVEQMVGVARVSDLTILWVLLAIFAALPRVREFQEAPTEAAPRQRTRPNPSRSQTSPGLRSYDWQLFLRLAAVAWLIGGIGILTWQKSLNYPRAAIMAGKAAAQFHEGDYETTLASLDRAIELAPDVPVYYNYRGQVYLAYRENKQVPQQKQCSLQKEVDYEVCLTSQALESNLKASSQRPFYYRSRLSLADSALMLNLNEAAVRLYQEVVDLVPGSPPLRIPAAEALLLAGQPQAVLDILDESLAFPRGEPTPRDFLFLQGLAYRDLGQLEESVDRLERSLAMGLPSNKELQAHRILWELYVALGQPEQAEHQSHFVQMVTGVE